MSLTAVHTEALIHNIALLFGKRADDLTKQLLFILVFDIFAYFIGLGAENITQGKLVSVPIGAKRFIKGHINF